MAAIAAGVLALAAGAALWTGLWQAVPSAYAQDVHDDHDDAGHDHAAHEDEDHAVHDGDGHVDDAHDEGHGGLHADDATGDADGHDDHAGHDDHEGHAEALAVRLTPEQMERFGIRLATAAPGRIGRQIRLPGEIVINADRSAHVVPPAGGIARDVSVKVGDVVEAGQPLVSIESADLSRAKTAFLSKRTELECCAVTLTRTEALHAGAEQLLEALATSPSLEALRALELPAMGERHAAVIAAYADLVLAEADYEREKQLVAGAASSQAEYQTATNAYKRATAAFIAAREALAFETQQALLEARQARQVLELELAAAAQELRILGLTESEIDAMANPSSRHAGGHECDDPNCADCEDHVADQTANHDHHESRLGLYALRAPFAGVVVEKHVALGEQLSGEESVFTIADLGSVWVDVNVYQKDLPFVRAGQPVRIVVGEGIPPAEATIAFVSPIVDSETRTATARIVLNNPTGVYRPGLFVTAEIDVAASSAAVVIPKAAVLRIAEEDVVFVPGDEGFVAQPVRLGRASRTHVEILEGLQGGQSYVAVGAFKLKAEIVTSGLGAHAGHGH
ncbi:MAG: efflux RND transporter periplasmic adaptor subunit [Planctomycetes bacterium]|nr:efflux RND transporter periplasmic adaptor subunit [Planctomycetota bacterium]